MFVRLTTAIATVSLLVSAVNASGKILQVVDSSNFCVMLPPNGETDRIIADTEWEGNAFCMGSTPKATGADKIPSGFITSAHFVATDAYVQVTGQIDYTKANLNGNDEGGQYDIKAPTGSSCAGWSYYVNLIEPTTNTYCIRCCNDTTNCNRGISEKGCAHIIPGDYSGPNGGSNSGITTAASTITTSKPADTTTQAVTTTTTTTATAAVTTTTTPILSTLTSTTTSVPNVVSPVASPATSPAITSDGVVTEQSINSADYKKPVALTIGAGILISAVLLN